MGVKNLWDGYKELIFETFPELYHHSTWAEWDGLTAKLYGTPKEKYINKSREVEIWDDKSCIYNNIIYPRTGRDVPCFGMDLMGFFDKKVIIVFDFQHPVEHHLFSHPDLPKSTGSFRFFEPGNHFSENIFVRRCRMDQVNDYLDDFKAYLLAYKEMLELMKPNQNFMYATYKDFDTYMKELDPVSGYLSNRFGKEKAESLVNDFLFCYA